MQIPMLIMFITTRLANCRAVEPGISSYINTSPYIRKINSRLTLNIMSLMPNLQTILNKTTTTTTTKPNRTVYPD